MLYVLLALGVLGLVTSTGFAAIVLGLFRAICASGARLAAAIAARPGFTPPLTLLKPLHGAEPGLEADLRPSLSRIIRRTRSVLRALGGGRRAQDCAPVAARYPQVPVKFLSTGGEPDYINAKVASMERMEAAAAHDDPGDQRQRCAGDAGLSARGGAAVCRSKVGWHDLSVSRRGGGGRVVGAA
jgi:ceramide glucosyltransferase